MSAAPDHSVIEADLAELSAVPESWPVETAPPEATHSTSSNGDVPLIELAMSEVEEQQVAQADVVTVDAPKQIDAEGGLLSGVLAALGIVVG